MPARGAREDEAESLTVLDLDAPELGIRPEDQYAAIPPGPRLIPRRRHNESSAAPLLLLGGLVLFFALGAWLGGAGSDEHDGTTASTGDPLPVLEESTGTELLLVGEGRMDALDVDGSRVRAVGDVSARSVLVPSAVPRRVWLTTPEPDGSTVVRELDVADGTETSAPIAVDGRVVGALSGGIVVERVPGALELVGADAETLRELGDQRTFVASAGDVLATRSTACTGPDCEITVDDFATGVTRQVRIELGSVGPEVAAISPDGRRLAVLRSDGVEMHGVVVDLRLATVSRFEARAAVRGLSGAPALAWSSDGNWLFVATVRSGINAVGSDGQVYRVDAELPTFSGIVTG
jgi:hypothetical protein